MTRSDIDHLIEQLDLRAKVAQLGTVRIGDLLEDGAFSRERAREVIPHGVGRVTRVGRESGLRPAELARAVADLQTYLHWEAPRGLPAFVREEGLCGYAGREGATVPQPINVASSWDTKLASELARGVAEQLRAVGCTLTLSPVADLGVDPRWGRIEETFGEDPALASRMTEAVVSGLDDGGVDATLKHFVGHGRPAGGRNRAAPTASLRAMRDADLRPFRAGVESGAPSVMAAYNAVDGVPCHANERLLTDLLREEWGFDGTVVSDGRGIEMLADDYGVVPDRQAAGIAALSAGIDVELPETECFGDRLVAAVEAGEVDESLVDRAVRRHLRQKERAGLFEDANPDPAAASVVFGTDEIWSLAERAARRSLVLLHNDGTLPLLPEQSVAVVGPSAADGRNLLGNYSYAGAENETGGIDVVTPLSALRERVNSVMHTRGCGIRAGPDDNIDAAVVAAGEADVAVAVVGGQSGIDVERDSSGTAGEALDRASLELPGRQPELVRRVAATGTPVVVVLAGGRPFAVPEVADHAAATVEAWLPGQAGGNAIADVLLGTDPGGRLPVSLPRSVGQLPIHYRRDAVSGGEYVFTEGSPLFPFGHGESYADFEYDDVAVEADEITGGGETTLSLAVENVADRPGSEVVQLYASDPLSSVVRPERELVGFQRLDMAASERVTVEFSLPAAALACYDADGEPAVEPGRFDLSVGRSSADVRGTASLTVTDIGRPDRRPLADATVRE
ncbi:glycoside hydrolase family 3 N-terminal domain-containing protein [Haloarcula amylovorans]|uniref:glycoside hydrolase family 3 N-terminal domain-containing protein n=1 Tax=Haloarcula amylovorans TaxID=2562280 RepID=UPI0014312C3B|nr:glycoside hydrolase family 3 N-terminal domain-containing protein [Halomicroarcula amylolytica]